MGLIAILFIGLVAGLVARALMPGRQTMGLVGTTLLGVAGSFVGSLVDGLLSRHDGWLVLRPSGLLFSIIGALVVLALIGLAQRGAAR